MELTEMRENFKRGIFGSFETLLDAYLTNENGFNDGEKQIFEECLYQLKINGGTPEANQVLLDRSSEELRAYYENSEKILKILKNL